MSSITATLAVGGTEARGIGVGELSERKATTGGAETEETSSRDVEKFSVIGEVSGVAFGEVVVAEGEKRGAGETYSATILWGDPGAIMGAECTMSVIDSTAIWSISSLETGEESGEARSLSLAVSSSSSGAKMA